jgi:hypothetical protein
MSPIEDEVANLKNWGRLSMDDRAWLEQLLSDYPGVLAVDIRECRDWWMDDNRKQRGKPVIHTRAAWKNRLRNWMKHKNSFGGGNGANKQGARALPAKYSPTPDYGPDPWGTGRHKEVQAG